MIDISKLWVIAVISNPIRFKTRYYLYHQFEKRMKAEGVNLLTVEMAFGDRPFAVTTADNPRNVQLRSFEELWHKENMINIGISRLPSDWEYVAWIDADVSFTNPNWVEETVHQLQHYMVIQLFSECLDLGPDFDIIQKHRSFCSSYQQNLISGDAYKFWHPGYAWAARREAIEHLGGLIDTAILGAADHHMALALIGQAQKSYPGNIDPSYAKPILAWQQRAEQFIKRDIGYVPGTILHYWHGKKKDRKYIERWDILVKNNFNPELDLKRDSQNLWQLTGRNIVLRDQVRHYFRGRNEDSIDL